MTDHPITPPPEQIKKWQDKFFETEPFLQLYDDKNLVVLLNQVYQAGADQELEACCLELVDGIGRSHAEFPSCLAEDLRAARRPKPPSLKEQALAGFERVLSQLYSPEARKGLEAECKTIRCAIEALPND